ncbi:MAG: antibiotic resistance protein VanZ [Labrenzia sp.]
MRRFPRIKFKLPDIFLLREDPHFIELSIGRVLPLAVLIAFGVLVGLVFETGVSHPYDKVLHIAFFALLTLSIHALFCCRLRISAFIAMSLGILGEIVQGMLPHHQMSVPDIVANAIGVSLVVALIALIRSETRQALSDETDNIDLGEMGLKPVPTRYLSGESVDDSGSGFSSDK